MSGLWRGQIVRSEAQLMKKAFAARAFRCLTQAPLHITALRFVRDDLWRGFAHFELGAYFLDLSGLLFELGC